MVTGLDVAGRSTVRDDRSVHVDGRAREALVLWATEDGVGARSPVPSSPIPEPGGATFVLLVLPPAVNGQAAIPMHKTATIDFGVVVAGAVTLELEDRSSVELVTGDLVVQTGTEHSWRNLGSEPCVIVFALLGTPI